MNKYMMRKSSTDIINWLNCIWLTNLPSNSKYLACYLRKFMNSNHDMAWPSYARIIEETGLSRATVAKYIKILEQEGWIKRESGNSTTNTVYFAILPEIIIDEVKEFDDLIQLKLKGSSPDKLRSTPAKQGVVREVNTNTQLNKQSNNQYTDTFSGKQKEMVNFPESVEVDSFHSENRSYSIREVYQDYNLDFCMDVMLELELLKERGCKVFTGELTLQEWQDCEDSMRSVDCFDTEYFTWWMTTRSKGMRKTPSLPNMLTDMNGIPFNQFYDSTFMQEWE